MSDFEKNFKGFVGAVFVPFYTEYPPTGAVMPSGREGTSPSRVMASGKRGGPQPRVTP